MKPAAEEAREFFGCKKDGTVLPGHPVHTRACAGMMRGNDDWTCQRFALLLTARDLAAREECAAAVEWCEATIGFDNRLSSEKVPIGHPRRAEVEADHEARWDRLKKAEANYKALRSLPPVKP